MSNDKKPIERVHRLIDAGAPVAEAIRIVLGGSIPKWAAKHGLPRTPATMTITGKLVPPNGRVVAALRADLQATDDELRDLINRATHEALANLATAS